MLRNLSIRDFVIVDRLDLEFSDGFTVFSGETGAGKSILIDAISIALGERCDARMIRRGQTGASITAEFTGDTLARPDLQAWLQAQSLPLKKHGCMVLRRVFDSHGRSRAFINNTPTTLSQLRELGCMLVAIHGQHTQQQLLHTDVQRKILDGYGSLDKVAAKTEEAYRKWQSFIKKYEEAKRCNKDLKIERERLEWEVSELNRLNPQAGEWDNINCEHRRLSQAASLIIGSQEALATLAEADQSIVQMLHNTVHRMRELKEIDAALSETLAALEPAEIYLHEAVHSLTQYVQTINLDPERLEIVETRLASLHSAARKFRVSPEELSQELQTRRAQLDKLSVSEDITDLQSALQIAYDQYLSLAQILSKERKKAAASLSQQVTGAMQDLCMPGSRFEVTLTPTAQAQSFGLETPEFLVASHHAIPTRPLIKVASGGELARINLALRVIVSSTDLNTTLIFDEVDSGIGGAIAEVVGRLLRKLGQKRQILCVTHLPQVAALGHQHMRVKKCNKGNSITTEIVSLIHNERVEEIARMLGGVEITSTTRKHAQEMLEL
ncbi:DNA repair protein RecN [Candidatus Pandoraea novymonadis]|uniref:DNA repair protein RecN n=1 Tax=Candidatus Pandoraea novymonadis TaxID=1808959 RepID=A0ABX5FEI4_9BURK|nr:DNA repair protein RecN [Candidatus Pandoraea novymonadis]PSB91873.1 DNA repair protein RecN [Candidatus Pandoraea novymonadis]